MSQPLQNPVVTWPGLIKKQKEKFVQGFLMEQPQVAIIKLHSSFEHDISKCSMFCYLIAFSICFTVSGSPFFPFIFSFSLLLVIIIMHFYLPSQL